MLVPTTFAQNDERFREEILRGEYPLPYRCVMPVDVRDVAAAAAWSATLGRGVRWTGADVAAFARLLETRLTGEKPSDFQKSFRLLSEIAMPAPTARQLGQTKFVLGRAPRSYAEYARDAAARWRVAAGG